MTIINTPELLVSVCKHSAGATRRITIRFSSPFPNPPFISDLAIAEDLTLPVTQITGTISPGTPPQPGNCSLRMGHTVFDSMFTFVSTHTALEVALTYDDSTHVVSAISYGSTLGLLATEATVRMIKASVGAGNISSDLSALNETAKALLQSVQELTEMLSKERRRRDSEAPASRPVPTRESKPERALKKKSG